MAITADAKKQLQKLAASLDGLPGGTRLYDYLEWIDDQISHPDPLFRKKYLPLIRKEKAAREADHPFLTVITRTQGKRPEMLRETLLCLSAQIDTDFELLLIGHKLTDEGHELVEQILSEQPASFRAQIRFIELNEGKRATPLNVGFARAHGDYVAILDDDDLVFDDWVEGFHKAAEGNEGSILHAQVLTQTWRTFTADETPGALISVGSYGTEYCVDFEPIQQMESNHCPLNGLAFPVFFFHKLGLIFDETLTTTEDWDFFMRTSFLSGVTDVGHPTCIYRLWENTDNSYVVHKQWEWQENYDLIQNKYAAMPVLLPRDCEKNFRIYVNAQPEHKPAHILAKEFVSHFVPKPVWNRMKKAYRAAGGKVFLG